MLTTILVIAGLALFLGSTYRTRFMRVVRSHIGALIRRAENPEKMIEHALTEMTGAYHQAREQTALAIAAQKKMARQLEEEQTETQRWMERARLAVNKNDDDLAREALRRKQEHATVALQIESQLVHYSAHVESLKSALDDLERKIEEARRRKNLLVAKQRRAEAQDRIYATMNGIQNEGGLELIERMEQKIDEICDAADARIDLKSEKEKLEIRFQQLESVDVETELSLLKNRRAIEYKPVESPVPELDMIREKSPLAVKPA
ncbi:MAG: PspA/IM30 family protein [Candidatus Niyogibacteria bacterium]|nr:PspA/IM30 family protein [Candidatus Niyogibacteria bacterium]